MGAGIEGRGEARRCKRGERNEGWSVGRISCLVSFTVARCVMTVEWIIISLSFRLPPPPRHSRRPFALVLRPSFEPFLRAAFVYPVRNLASAFSTFSPFPLQPSSLQRHAKRNGQRVDGWVVGRGREGPSKGATTLRGGGVGLGREIKAERSAKCSFFRASFPPSDRCYQHARVFLPAHQEDSWGWLDGYGGGKERKKGKKGRAVEERRKADANPVKRG